MYIKFINLLTITGLFISSSYANLVPRASSSNVIYGDTFDSMFFGAWVGGPEKLPEYPFPNTKNVASFEALQGRHLDVINHYVSWQYNSWEWTRSYLDVAKANGSIMLIAFMPSPYTAQDVLNGKGDAYIDTFVKGIKSYGEEIWIRPLHESNGDWYSWGTGRDNVNNAEKKVAAAFRYIVDKFRAAKVTNVKWVWTTNNGCSGAGTTHTGSYPGNDYVDYISIDGYNYGTIQSWSRWSSFEEVFREVYNAVSKYPKPIFLAEFSSTEVGGSKAQWITEMFRILPTKFPRIIGLLWFNESKPDGDWGLDTSKSAVEAWKKGMSAYPPAKRIGSNKKSGQTVNKAAQSVKPKECWSEKLGYKCCSPGNIRIYVTDASGPWGVENKNWCGITEKDDKCWSLSYGYKCCNHCHVIYTDESGKWGAINDEWCGIVEDTCK
jgi:hypothetical protein